MVQLKCDCSERHGIEIDSYMLFTKLKSFFDEQVSKKIFTDIPVTEPYYVGYSRLKKMDIKWYATKWYKCNACGCLWEFNYPEFPAKGFVKKYKSGFYKTEET